MPTCSGLIVPGDGRSDPGRTCAAIVGRAAGGGGQRGEGRGHDRLAPPDHRV